MRHYSIKDQTITTDHFADETSRMIILVRDGTQWVRRDPRAEELDASVKSGELFLTLATILDSISDDPELEQIVRDLMYLQQNYKIIKR